MLESIISWTLNGQAQAPFLCTPDALEEMVVGNLLTLRIIASQEQLISLALADQRIDVKTAVPTEIPRFIDQRLESLSPLSGDLRLRLDDLRQWADKLTSEEEYYGTHRIVLRGPLGELTREDIGRHNAVDKVIGAAWRKGWDLSRCALGATGRISLEILSKAAALGIPILFSKKYPSDLSSQWATRLDMAIVAKIQSEEPEITGASWRIIR